MIKIDFVDWSLLSAHHFYDPAVSRAMAYRKGFEIMRKAIGNDCHLQDCGPGPVTVGLLDSMRIELDMNYGYAGEVWKTYLTTSASSAPASVLLLSIHEKSGMPKVISTDRHILQGAVELEDVTWDAVNQVLTGISIGAPDSAYNLYIYVPDSHPWQQGGTSLYHDFPGYTLKMADNNILRMHIRFDNESRISWSINFHEFFKMD